MKYNERACKFNMDTGCVELLLRDGRKISIDCTGIEDALDVTMAQRSELDYLIYNDPLGGFLCEKICPVAFFAGIFVPEFLQKIHAGRVAAAYRMCYDEVQNLKRSDGS